MTTKYAALHEALENLGFENYGEGEYRWFEPTEGFRVRVETHQYDWDKNPPEQPREKPRFWLSLPHQCDEWEITDPHAPDPIKSAKEFREGLERAIQMLGTVERLIEMHPA